MKCIAFRESENKLTVALCWKNCLVLSSEKCPGKKDLLDIRKGFSATQKITNKRTTYSALFLRFCDVDCFAPIASTLRPGNSYQDLKDRCRRAALDSRKGFPRSAAACCRHRGKGGQTLGIQRLSVKRRKTASIGGHERRYRKFL